MGNSHKFWDRLARRYAKSPVSDEATYQAKLEKTRAYFTPDSSVLEFGCGTGSTAVAHAPYVRKYLATDISGKMLEIARAKAEGIQNLRFEQCGLEGVKPPGSGYDAVLGHSILHLVEDRDAAVTMVFSLLKPGGVFVSSTICLGRGGLLKPFLVAGHFIGLLPLIRFFSTKALIRSMEAAGFEIDHSWQPDPKSAMFLIAIKPS